MKWINNTVKEYLLLFFVFFLVLKGYGQDFQSSGINRGGAFSDEGSSQNVHVNQGSVGISLLSAKNASQVTEGALIIEFNDLTGLDGNHDRIIYSSFGVWSTNKKLYDYNSAPSLITGAYDYGIQKYHEGNNAIMNIGGYKSGWFYIGDIGPNNKATIKSLHSYGRGDKTASGDDFDRDWREGESPLTPKLKNVVDLKFENGQLAWKKGTKYKKEILKFEIWRKAKGSNGLGSLIATLDNATPKSGTDDWFLYRDEEMDGAMGNYTYTIYTLLNDEAPSDWNKTKADAEAGKTLDVIYKFTPTFIASQDLNNKIKLEWGSLEKIQNIGQIRIYRDAETIEIARLSKTTENYIDNDVTPGKTHRYTLKLFNSSGTELDVSTGYSSKTTTGKSLPNGAISGTVKTASGVPLEGVRVYYRSKVALDANKYDSPSGSYIYDSATTDNSGYFQFADIYYDSSTLFDISPYPLPFTATNKRYQTPVITRTLKIAEPSIKDVDFVDTASFIVSGVVYFPKEKFNSPHDVPLANAEVWLNNKNTGVKTNKQGQYYLPIPNAGSQVIAIKFDNHKIYSASNISATSATVFVSKDVNNVDFVDHTFRQVSIKAHAYKNRTLGELIETTLRMTGLNANRTDTLIGKQLELSGLIKAGQTYIDSPTSAGIFTSIKAGDVSVIVPAAPVQFMIQKVAVRTTQNGIDPDHKEKREYFQSRPISRDFSLEKIAHIDGKDTTYTSVSNDIEFTYYDDTKIFVAINQKKDLGSIALNRPLSNLFEVTNLGFGSRKEQIFDEKEKEKITIHLLHEYSYPFEATSSDPLTNGTILISDNISDTDLIEIPIDSLTERAEYTIVAGKPYIDGTNFFKTLSIIGQIKELNIKSREYKTEAIVVGENQRIGTFYTRTPEKPLFILHDPPGDNSYATISKGTSFNISQEISRTKGDGAGVDADIKAGFGGWSPVAGDWGVGIHAVVSYTKGDNNTTGSGTSTSISFTQDFSTSSSEDFVGHDGDVYVGNSQNITYALADVLKYNRAEKTVTKGMNTLLDSVGINTTFIYTEKHIRETLMGQFATLIKQAALDSAAAFSAMDARGRQLSGDLTNKLKDADFKKKYELHQRKKGDYFFHINNQKAWTAVLKQNEENRENAATYDKGAGYLSNISFSSGASYTNTVSKEASASTTTTFESFWELSAGIGAYAAGFGAEADILATFGKSVSNVTTDNTEQASTDAISFHLEDDDAGDFFSIDVKEDPQYKTPVFKLLAGTASCPTEDGAQRRYLPSLMPVGTQTQVNVPVGKPALFYVRMANFSESDEEGTFSVRLVSTKNLNGAKVLFGGQDITNGVATYSLKPATNDEREAYIVPVEIYKGAVGVEFKDIQIVMNPECEGGTDLSDDPFRNYVNLSATWQNTCSSVTLFTPGNNWVVNKSNNNLLNIVLSDYDATENSSLTNVVLQYRRLNSPVNWSNLTSPITKAQLAAGKSYQEFVSVAGLPDGEYELRLVTSCGDGTNYSPTYVGKIDRTIVSIYGIPTPANGILTASDIISVEFNKNIRSDANNPIKVKLVNAKTGVVYPATFVLNGKRIEIKTDPTSKIEDLENEALKVSVWNIFDNDAGNFLTDTISWSFIVNRSPLYWAPNTKQIDINEGNLGKFGAVIKSKVAVEKNFTITSFPSWITPSIRNSKVSPLGEVNIDFGISNSLNTGTYIDTIKMNVDGREQYFYLTVNVLKEAPKWSVDPSKYKYNMNIVTQFSLTDQNAPLSEDTFDKIAVVVGNEIRGVAHIEYDNTLNKYYAFITAYSNDVKETMSYRFWDARPGIEYVAKESTAFVNGGVIGTVNTPFILHPTAMVQTIPLKKGWNWISLYLDNTDMSVKNVMSTLKSNNGDVVTLTVNDGSMSEYSKEIGWAGSMTKMSVYKGYRVYVSKPDTIRWVGNFVKTPVIQAFNKGWNSLGFPVPYNAALNIYFKNVAFPNGSRILSQDEFAVYDANTKTWSGSLKYMRPGKGYRLQATDESVEIPFTIYTVTTDPNVPPVVPPGAPELPAGPTTIIGHLDSSTTVNVNNYESLNTTTVAINIGGTTVNVNNADSLTNNNVTNITNRYEINTVVNNTVVGITNIQSLTNGEIRGFVTTSSDSNTQGEDVKFIVKDVVNNLTYEAKPSITVNIDESTHIGSISNPVVLSLEGASNIEVKTDLLAQTIGINDELLYTVDLKNIGNDIAVNVRISESIPSGFDIVKVTTEKGNITSGDNTYDYQLVNLPKDGTDRIAFVLKPNRVGIYNIGNMEATVNNDIDISNNTLYAKEIEVIDERANVSKVFIPEFISPNGDGINDRFEIVGLGQFLTDVNVIIYDRSSNVIFRDTNYQNSWDGGNYPVASYGYYIKGKDREGKTVEFKGYVAIVR